MIDNYTTADSASCFVLLGLIIINEFYAIAFSDTFKSSSKKEKKLCNISVFDYEYLQLEIKNLIHVNEPFAK